MIWIGVCQCAKVKLNGQAWKTRFFTSGSMHLLSISHVRESGLTPGKGIIGNVGGAQIKAPMMLHITNLWAKIMCLFTLFRSLQRSWDLVSPGNWSII